MDLTKDGKLSRWTLILGDNGLGKTTLLECLALMRPSPWSESVGDGPEEGAFAKYEPILVGRFSNDDFLQYSKIGERGVSKIGAILSHSINLDTDYSSENEFSFSVEYQRFLDPEKKKPDIKDWDVHFSEETSIHIPKIFAYGANRFIGSNNYESEQMWEDSLDNLVKKAGELFDPEEVLHDLNYEHLQEFKAAFDKGAYKPETPTESLGKYSAFFVAIKKLILDILPVENKDADNILVKAPVRNGILTERKIEINTLDGTIAFQDLSLGYRTAWAWITDLAIRMFWEYPNSQDPLKEPAIVIVDEIDLHLHPKWQRTIRSTLEKHFKRTQFVCTAHSPYMAQALEDENICVLGREGNEVKLLGKPLIIKGGKIGLFATGELFGLEEGRSPQVEAMITRRRLLLDKLNLTPEEIAELENLDQELDDIPIAEDTEEQEKFNELKRIREQLIERGLIQ